MALPTRAEEGTIQTSRRRPAAARVAPERVHEFRVVPYWPRDRYLELAPKYWFRTRARLDAKQLAMPLGPITVPPAEQQPAPS